MSIPQSNIDAALHCMRLLAGDDKDRASIRNDVGFSQSDCALGHKLAKMPTLSEVWFHHAKHLTWRYRRQLGDELVKQVYAGFESPASEALLNDLAGEPEQPTTSKVEAVQQITPPSAVMTFDIIDDSEEDILEHPPTEATEAEFLNSRIPPENYTGVALTEEQHHAVELILRWLGDSSGQGPIQFRLGGYAGTGKTTLLKYLLAYLAELRRSQPSHHLASYHAMVAAFTGKACNVLRRKGIQAATIHSTMYRPVRPEGGAPSDVEWLRIPYYELPGNLWIIDEASMISTEIYEDMKSYGLKMLFVGDPGQLEPVGDNPNLMRNPDFALKTIHRQALESPIISLATDIRHGFPIPRTSPHPDLVVRMKDLTSHDILSVTQVICGKNATRNKINLLCRQAHRRTEPLEVGDKLIITKNNKDMGVFNGMIVFVKSIRSQNHRCWVALCEDEEGKSVGFLPIAKEPLSPTYDPKTARIGKDLVIVDYGYCITCHKSQGSEWEHVMVIDEWVPAHIWDMKRWRYTAFTRAAKRLTICIDPPKR